MYYTKTQPTKSWSSSPFVYLALVWLCLALAMIAQHQSTIHAIG